MSRSPPNPRINLLRSVMWAAGIIAEGGFRVQGSSPRVAGDVR
jgi:hypothetical protein